MDNDKAARPQPPIDRPDPAKEPPAGSVGDARPSDAADTPAAAPALAEAAEPAGDEAAAAPPKPRVIVMHASVGSGHRSAAMAVAQAFELLRDEAAAARAGIGDAADGTSVPMRRMTRLPAYPFPRTWKSRCIDVLDYGRIVFDGDNAASLFTGATRPIYDLTWRFTLTGRLLWGGGTVWSRLMYPAFTEHVREVRPLAIVCTHITAANVAVGGAHAHRPATSPSCACPPTTRPRASGRTCRTDLFCVANESMAETLRPRKVPEERIRITGIPTREDFRRSLRPRRRRASAWTCRRTSASCWRWPARYLPRPYVHFRDALDKLLPYLHALRDMHFVFVAGSDADYARHLRQECDDLGLSNVTVLDYVEDMAALMAASDLVICKSGGLTVTECLCAQVPMILLGQAPTARRR